MIIDTEDDNISGVEKRLENAKKGVISFTKEIEEIEKISIEEIEEAKIIESLLYKLKQSKKLDSKKEALEKQIERVNEIEAYLN